MASSFSNAVIVTNWLSFTRDSDRFFMNPLCESGEHESIELAG
jgi:hypothetical protein